MLRIAIDMDEVIADVLPKFQDLYFQKFGVKVNPDDHYGKKIYQLPGALEIRNELYKPGFFADLPVIEGAQAGIRELQEHYEIYIVTAASEFRHSLGDKHDWLQEHFPSIHWKNMIFCGDKSIIRTDYMIDDHAFNLETFQGKGLLFTAHHNVEEKRFTRVNNWAEVTEFFRKEREA